MPADDIGVTNTGWIRDPIVLASVGIGSASSAIGYWIGPVVGCPYVNEPSGQYCGLNWWLINSNLIPVLGGLVAGGLFGLLARVWVAALVGIILGNVAGPLIGLWIATQTPGHDAVFGDPPQFGATALAVFLVVFTVVGQIMFNIGWAVAGLARKAIARGRPRP